MSGFQTDLAEPSTSRTSQRGSFFSRRWPECLTLAACAGLMAFIIPHHEPWVDEAQAWQLVRSMPLGEIFRTYLRYEGHPGLWHLVLSALMHLGVTYNTLPWFCAASALAGVALLLFFAPFPRSIRLALPFTFFLIYQYAVIARGYVFVPLLLFTIAMAWRRSPILLAVLLGLMGSLALHALAIGGGLVLLYLLERLRERTLPPRAQLVAAGAILLAFLSFIAWTVWPPHDLYVHRPEMHDPLYLRIAVQFFRGLDSLAMGLIEPALLGIPIWILLWRYFHRRGQLIYLLPAATFALFSTQYLQHWHAGLIVPTLITIFWIAQQAPHAEPQRVPRWERIADAVALAFVLVFQVVWAGHAIAFDYSHLYSPDRAAAQYLAPRIEAGDKIAVTYLRDNPSLAFYSVGIEPYFHQKIYMNRDYPFWFFSTRDRTESEFFHALEQHPAIVIAEFNQFLLPPRFDPSRDLGDPKVTLLRNHGYDLTQVFCGEQPYHLRSRSQSCHLIFERTP